MPATMSPEVRSLLIRSAAAGGGAVHGEVTSRDVWGATQLVDDVDAGGLAWSAVDAVGCRDDDQQLHVALIELVGQDIAVAWDDSEVGSWNPLADRLLRDGDAEDPEGDRQQRRDER